MTYRAPAILAVCTAIYLMLAFGCALFPSAIKYTPALLLAAVVHFVACAIWYLVSEHNDSKYPQHLARCDANLNVRVLIELPTGASIAEVKSFTQLKRGDKWVHDNEHSPDIYLAETDAFEDEKHPGVFGIYSKIIGQRPVTCRRVNPSL
jgi:hypothetical protein